MRILFIASLSTRVVVHGRSTLKVLAADPGHQNPERTHKGDDEGWEVEELVYKDADWRRSRHKSS
jgi:hypothetical protein